MYLVVLLSVLAQASPELPELRPSNLGGVYRRGFRTGLVTVDGPFLALTEAREGGVLRVITYDPAHGVRTLARNGNQTTDFRHAQSGSLVVTSGLESLMGDLNGDGDAADLCVIASDLASGELLAPRAITLSNLGDPWNPFAGRGLVGFTLSEAGEGMHLNGDADLTDMVGAAWQPSSSSTVIPGRASQAIYPLENALLLRVAETGERDFTGDGDRSDTVYLVYDFTTETLLDTGVALSTSNLYAFQNTGTRVVALPASEAGSGADLNNDGDMTDVLLAAYSLDRGALDILGTTGPTYPHIVSGRWVAFPMPESVGGDLNGDGDALDDVLEVYDGGTGTIVNTGWAIVAVNMLAILGGSELGFFVDERAQGADLDGDGDTVDSVFFQRDFATGTTRNTGLAGGASAEIFLASEPVTGRDLNGDGDLGDSVPQILGPAAGSGVSLGVASTEVKLSEGWAALLVSESMQGADLNGDGDQLDYVLHGYERATGTLTNFGLVPRTNAWALAGRLVGCVLDEAGVVDLNGDGDKLDHVVHRVDLKTGTVENLRLATGANDPLWMTNDLFAFVVEELDQGADLDGNGVIEDVGLVHVVNRGRILRR